MPRTKHVSTGNDLVLAECEPSAHETLGAYLRRVRLIRGASLPDVVQALANLPSAQSMSRQYLLQIEWEQIPQPSDENLQTLAQVLQIKPEWLLEKARQPLKREHYPLRQCNRVGELNGELARHMEPSDQKLLLHVIDKILSHRRSPHTGTSQATEDLPSENES